MFVHTDMTDEPLYDSQLTMMDLMDKILDQSEILTQTGTIFQQVWELLLLMAEILHHLGCLKNPV